VYAYNEYNEYNVAHTHVFTIYMHIILYRRSTNGEAWGEEARRVPGARARVTLHPGRSRGRAVTRARVEMRFEGSNGSLMTDQLQTCYRIADWATSAWRAGAR